MAKVQKIIYFLFGKVQNFLYLCTIEIKIITKPYGNTVKPHLMTTKFKSNEKIIRFRKQNRKTEV